MLFLMTAAMVSFSQAELVCQARVDRTSVISGGTIALTVTAEGDISGSVNFDLPAQVDDVVTGTSYSRSQSYSGNKMTLSIAQTYYLAIKPEGSFQIGPIVVSDDQGNCSTEPIVIKVSSAGIRPSPSVTGNRQPAPSVSSSRENGVSPSGGKAGDDIFITLTTDRKTAWIGQQVVMTFRYYHRSNPWNQPKFQDPRTPGFWRESMGPQKESRTTIQGRAYGVVEIQYALFPTKTGDLVIEPAELSFPDTGLNSFFSSRRRRGPRTLRTDPITISVKQLPPGKPDDFSGLVASEVRLLAGANLDSVPRAEPLDFKVHLISDAFLKGFEGVKVPEPADARIHDAGSSFRTAVEKEKLLGQVSVEKVIVPSLEGTFALPSVSLSWFDVRTGRYRTSRTPDRTVFVTASDHPFAGNDNSGFLRNEVSRLGQDLVFIHDVPNNLRGKQQILVQTGWWWSLLLLPLVMIACLWGYQQRQKLDPALQRKQYALKHAITILDGSSEMTNDSDVQSRAIYGFVADCTGRPLASVGTMEVLDFCEEKHAQDHGKRLVEIIDVCDSARFGGAHSHAVNADTSTELKTILKELHVVSLKGINGASLAGAGLVLFFSFMTVSPLQAATDPARLMAEANQAYTQDQGEVALDLYRQAVALGAEDPHLYFNLGNAHARQGQMGFAVVNYLRAERLAPRDRDIKDNLAWVRGNIKDLELSETDLPLFIAQIVSLVFALTLGQWAWLLLVAVWGLAFATGVPLWRRQFTELSRRFIILSGTLVLLSSAVVLWRWNIEEVRRTAVVTTEEVAVRSGPDESFGVQFMVHDGLTIRIQEERKQWVRISLGGESLGWLPVSSVEEVRSGSFARDQGL